MTIHSFEERLAYSEKHADSPWWETVYRKAFPSFACMARVQRDEWGQRAGMDRTICLKCGRIIRVEEKVRSKVRDDFCLERWSNEARQTPGWIQKPLNADFLAYAFEPSATVHLLPFLLLQRAWRLRGRDWIETYREIKAPNNGYVTISVAVPIPVVLDAIKAAMTICTQTDLPLFNWQVQFNHRSN